MRVPRRAKSNGVIVTEGALRFVTVKVLTDVLQFQTGYVVVWAHLRYELL